MTGVAKTDIKLVSDELLECVKERTLDKKVGVEDGRCGVT